MIKEFDLTDKEIEEINELNTRLAALNNLAKDDHSKNIAESIVDKLITARKEYDEWFSKTEKRLNVQTTPTNSWNVDFDNKKIQLL